MARANYWITLIAMVLLAFFIGIYIYYSQIDGIWVNRPIVFHYWQYGGVITHKTTKEVYKPGEMVYATISASKPKVWPGIIQWSLVDGMRRCYLPRQGALEAGRNERVVEVERIPYDITPGVDYFTGTVTFDLNFIRRKLHLPIQTNTFRVEVDK